MKKFFKYALLLLGLDVFLFLLLSLKPVPSPLTKAECLEVSGVVTSLSGGGVSDIVITLDTDERQYYINRLLTEENEEFGDWHARLKGRNVTLYYPNYWTPLDYAGKQRHLSLVEVEGKEFWGELEE
jgi:hypothetical protein